ncbi:hypothetical protein GKZ90_0002995 [Flavobacterium sp. MC2016-06]|jgi:hypothetical protein|uniref:hypothetical protein n=1 Tax=Flavobacterium sp. MC2016-06 TaxID=2676308 RepID=UPI0012BB15CC|nr:hypothetical protein [Flavobacterium sp. MC2016-06]MBU3860668.1 hypothetical protein [Flavobacterium sp. MC2016-06]
MKRIISILIVGILMSCSNETEIPQADADAAIIRLMKSPDKNTLSLKERKEILDHLEKQPEDIKYLMPEGYSVDKSYVKPDLRRTAKTADYTIGEYMMIRVYPEGGPDYGGSLEDIPLGSFHQLIYGWTIAENILGLFDIVSYERLMVYDNGPLGAYNYSYQIQSAGHAGSGLRGQYGPLGWSETGRNVAYTNNYVWFYTTGDVIQGTGRVAFGKNKTGNINSIVYSNGAYSVGW